MLPLVLVSILFLIPLAGQTPTTGAGWFSQGLAQHRNGAYGDAIQSFQAALGMNYNVPGCYMRIARAYAKQADINQSIAMMERSAAAGFAIPGAILADADLASIRADARFAPILEKINRNARPCESNAGFRTFDFWIGEWDVTSLSGKSESSIEKLAEGCAIFENWYGGGKSAGPGTTGKSLNVFSPATGKWRQLWISDTGVMAEYVGEFRDGAVRFEREFVQNGVKTMGRMTFSPLEPGKVRQLIEQSTDGGQTWSSSFDGLYVRKTK